MEAKNSGCAPAVHFVLVPLVAQGHMIPMVSMARILADRGARVSFITTPVNAARISGAIEQFATENSSVEFVELDFPRDEESIPMGCESLDLIPTFAQVKPFFRSLRGFAEPLERYLRAHQHPPDCMISDMCNSWTAGVSLRLGISRLVFHGPSCFYILAVEILARVGIYEHTTGDGRDLEMFPMPPEFPVHVELCRAQAPHFLGWTGWSDILQEARAGEAEADGVVINSFEELELDFLTSYKDLVGKKVWAAGPMCSWDRNEDTAAARGNTIAVDRQTVIRWLDEREAGSVIYVNFGSIARSGPMQVIEIGTALEASNVPFLWVVKEMEKVGAAEEWLAGGFEERVKDRGLVVTGWAPQMVILKHRSVGGFLTHCGWNSTVEAIAAGIQMATWPRFGDQFLNEKLVVDVLKVGVRVGVKLPYTHLKPGYDVVMERESIEKAIRQLMERGGDEGEQRRERAKKLSEQATKATEEGGSSLRNLDDIIKFAEESRMKKKA